MNPGVFNTRIVSDGDILPCYAISRAPSVLSAMALTRLKTIINTDSITRWIQRLISLTLKWKQALHAHILSNAPIVIEITKWTQTYVHSRSIGSIMYGMLRNMLRSVKTDQTQSIQLWTTLLYELWCLKIFLSKY